MHGYKELMTTLKEETTDFATDELSRAAMGDKPSPMKLMGRGVSLQR